MTVWFTLFHTVDSIIVSALFFFGESELIGGSAKATAVMICCRPFFFLFSFFFRLVSLPYSPCYRPYAMPVSFSLFVLFLSVKQQLSSVLFGPCNRHPFLLIIHQHVCMVFRWQLQHFLSFPILLHHILQETCRLFCFFFFFLLFLSFLFSICLCFFHGLACFVVFSFPVRWHLTCFIVIDCDCLVYSVSQSVTTELYLSSMNQHGLWVR